MTLATPARVTTAAPLASTGARAPALWLLPAAMVCGYGLGLAGLAALAPPPRVAPLPSLDALAVQQAAPLAAPRAAADWAPLFGTRPEAAPEPDLPEPEPEPAYDPADDFDPSIYILRGLATGSDASEAFALIETPDGAMMAHVGDLLPEGYEVLQITDEGVLIDVYGEPRMIGFAADAEAVDGDLYDGDLRSRADGPSTGRVFRRDEGPSPPRQRFPLDYPGDGPSDRPFPRDRFENGP